METRTRTIIDPTKLNSPHPFTNIRWLRRTRRRSWSPIPFSIALTGSLPFASPRTTYNTIYYGSQFVLRSEDRGDHWEVISPDLTTNNPDKINTQNTSIQHCTTIVTLDESAAQAGVIWGGHRRR